MDKTNTPLGTVFITGGCGLLGNRIIQTLLEQGHPAEKIFAFDLLIPKNRVASVTYIAGDLGSKQDVGQALDRAQPNVLINTASPDPTRAGKIALERCNVLGAWNMVSCAQERGIRVLVHTSSVDAAQDAWHDFFNVEELPAIENPVGGDNYAVSKSMGERLVLKANREKGLLTCALRPSTMTGEGDKLFLRHCLEGGRSGSSRFQIGQGKNLYDFVYVGNVAEAHVLAAKALVYAAQKDGLVPEEERVDGEAFNISNADPMPFWLALRFICREAGYMIEEKDVWKIPMSVVVVLFTIWEALYWIFTFGGAPQAQLKMLRYTVQNRTWSIEKARKRLGYEPKVNTADGFRRGLQWYLLYEKEQNIDVKKD